MNVHLLMNEPSFILKGKDGKQKPENPNKRKRERK
jgi:hypothetical protein